MSDHNPPGEDPTVGTDEEGLQPRDTDDSARADAAAPEASIPEAEGTDPDLASTQPDDTSGS